jgi:hypothetical protein
LLTLSLVLAGCGNDREEPSTAPQTSATPTDGSADFTVLSPQADGSLPLEPGRYALRPNGLPGLPFAVIEVPKGFVGLGGVFLLAYDPPPDDPFRAVGYWTVAGVFKDPCAARGLHDPGPSVDDLADALAAQRLTSTTEPVPVSVGGHQGIYLELTHPTDVAYDSCRDADLDIWDSSPGGSRHIDIPGLVDRLWILDVEGERAVLSTAAGPGVTRHQVRELSAIIESTRFVEQG